MNVASFNCTQCGAGLDVLGGGRVKSHICSYCGAELDAQDAYRVIRQFRDMKRPRTPFDLGMTGALWGVPFTVIGTIAWVERHGGRAWHWVEHQIFSPTHGYAWLSIENGFVTFTRKSREASSPPGVSENRIEHSEIRPTVQFQGRTYTYFASGRAQPTFIEGEFNFRPTLEDRIRYVSLMGATKMLDIIDTAQEREYEVTELPDQAALFKSFGVTPERIPRSYGTHPLDPIERSPDQLFARDLAIATTLVALVLAFFLTFKGEVIAQTEQTKARRDVELPFTVTKETGLTEIEIYADAYNSWAWFEAELEGGEGDPVAIFEAGVEYYSGSDWSEGSHKVRTRLDLPPGDYTLYLEMTEAQVDWSGGHKANSYSATVRQGVANAIWLWGVAAITGVVAFVFLGQRYLHHKSRWAGSDWSDE